MFSAQFPSVIVLIIIPSCYFLPNKPQQNVLLQLCNNLSTRNLVVIHNNLNHITFEEISFTKYFSKNNIFLKYLSAYQANATMQDIFIKKKYFPKVLVLLIDDVSFFYLFYKYLGSERYLPNYIWVAFKDYKTIIDTMVHQYIPYDCQFLAINEKYEIVEVYHLSRNSPQISTKLFGVWDEEKGIELNKENFYQRRFDMNGTALEILDDYGLPCISPIICAYRQMIDEMGRMMNFENKFRPFEKFQELWYNNQSVYYEVTLDAYLFDYYQYMKDMVAPIWKTPAFLHIRYRIEYEEGYSTPFKRPFTDLTWRTIIYWILLSGTCIVIINYIMYKSLKFGNFNIIDSFFLGYDSYVSQCGSKVPKSISPRIAIFMSRTLTTFLSPLYSAVLISFLTVQVLNLPFTNLQGLVDDGSFKIAYENDTAVRFFLKMAKDPLIKLAYEKFALPPDKLPANPQNWTEQICKDPNYAFIYFNNDIFRKQLKIRCKVIQIPTPVFVTWDGFSLRNHSSYRKIFNKILKSFFSSGVLSKLEGYVYGKAPPEKEKKSQEPVKIDRVIELHRFLFFFHGISLLIFSLEIFYYSLKMKRKQMKINQIVKYKQRKRKYRLAYQLIAR